MAEPTYAEARALIYRRLRNRLFEPQGTARTLLESVPPEARAVPESTASLQTSLLARFNAAEAATPPDLAKMREVRLALDLLLFAQIDGERAAIAAIDADAVGGLAEVKAVVAALKAAERSVKEGTDFLNLVAAACDLLNKLAEHLS